MKLNYYVLGKKDNEMLINYLEKYYYLLIDYLNLISSKGILINEIKNLLSINNKDFILNPDYSSIINLIYKESVLNYNQGFPDINLYVDKLKIEIDNFVSGKYDLLSMNIGKNIYGTKIKLTTNDYNPYNLNEEHPDHGKNGTMIGYGNKSEEDWLKIYEKTFELLKDVDDGIYNELNLIIKKIIPLGTSEGIHNSCSYKECIGHLYMGYTIDSDNPEINNLEAIIHESSHNKLNLIMNFDSVILNDKQEKYYSAIRPDARHIHGVFLGYHAFAPTMYVIMKAYYNGLIKKTDSLFQKIVFYHLKTKLLQRVIKKYAKLTPLGLEISKEIDYVISDMDLLLKKLNPPKYLIDSVRKKQAIHFSEVNSKYPYLEY